MFPNWPAKSEGGQKKKDSEPKAPEAGNCRNNYFIKKVLHHNYLLQQDFI